MRASKGLAVGGGQAERAGQPEHRCLCRGDQAQDRAFGQGAPLARARSPSRRSRPRWQLGSGDGLR
eukprot:5427457-Heterocapsa_arctica.AAC.1